MPKQQSRGRQRKITEYGSQLQEKQRLRNNYGLREKQFRRYFENAAKHRGQTGRLLLETLERRLDNVVFRAGLAHSRAQARQMINHRHFKLNSTRVSIPSIIVQPGDVLEPYKKELAQLRPESAELEWLDVDKKTLKVTVKELPGETELPIEFDTQKVIEFYSR
jgi:small subunit ribosomal protein S4